MMNSDAASVWAGWALAYPEFGVSVNPIPTRGADYAHRITACPPGFENLAASLLGIQLNLCCMCISNKVSYSTHILKSDFNGGVLRTRLDFF